MPTSRTGSDQTTKTSAAKRQREMHLSIQTKVEAAIAKAGGNPVTIEVYSAPPYSTDSKENSDFEAWHGAAKVWASGYNKGGHWAGVSRGVNTWRGGGVRFIEIVVSDRIHHPVAK